MSRRTAASNKAIRDAWKNEQNLVKVGKGTRDWTIRQQKDILERGKAYDEKGKAFEGQHMRSAEAHPECQGDPKNIQFLTRAEHKAAHGGNWRNPTNWYYDPVTKEILDFGEGPIIPCNIIKLSESKIKMDRMQHTTSKDEIHSEVDDDCEKYAQIVEIKVEIVEEDPPLLHDLTSLQIQASQQYGLTALETLNCVQRLYEEGDITYPRTGSHYITSDMGDTVASLLPDAEEDS